jgi:hypothetical protein
MNAQPLHLWGNGAVTLPKAWRDRYATKHFLAKENAQGYLVIIPVTDMEYYEQDDGTCGLKFPMGVDMAVLADQWQDAMDDIDKTQKDSKTSGKKKKNSSR